VTTLTSRLRRMAVDDRESGATSVELVLYTPVLILVIFLTVQFALSWHGNSIAGAVARETARAARAGGGTTAAIAAAEARGAVYADAVGGSALTDVSIDVFVLPGDQIRVTVTGRANEIVDGMAPRVEASVQGPIEVFHPDT
jgi:Flp pilus assembly protein TadG